MMMQGVSHNWFDRAFRSEDVQGVGYFFMVCALAAVHASFLLRAFARVYNMRDVIYLNEG